MKTFTAVNETTLREFTDGVYPQGSFCFNALLKGKDIKVNGVRCKTNIKLSAGDEVVYYTTPGQEALPSHKVVYEDENIIVADKYSGVSSEGLFSELSSKGECYFVHRLDRNTSGLIIFAKTKETEDGLLTAFKLRKVHKTYIALCKNCFKRQKGVLKDFIVKADGGVKISKEFCAGAKTAITGYEILEDRGDIALVGFTLYTGRTHQIRAHTASIGCPVLGDEKYGDGLLNAKYGARRQKLVAKYLKFELDGKLSYLNDLSFESSFGL